MKRAVVFSPAGRDDLIDLYEYAAARGAPGSADDILQLLEARCASLDELAERGRVPPELARINVPGFLEIVESPYRILYEIDGKRVLVHGVLDGRRDLQELLVRRVVR